MPSIDHMANTIPLPRQANQPVPSANRETGHALYRLSNGVDTKTAAATAGGKKSGTLRSVSEEDGGGVGFEPASIEELIEGGAK
ncbi:unnamed protein product [Tilletia laevis]|uniref:Uncharacterized protein n=1 Tax=Tilletia laevis TaxID=157183 RepID=A0A9N8QQY9_9BASI|nr:unnamed protein product [Tilletia laevis]